MIVRSTILVALFVGAFSVRAMLDSPMTRTDAEPLSRFPTSLGQWQGRDLLLEPDVIKMAAVDDHLNRLYVNSTSTAGLYIGYYQSQRQGEALHSPLFCLPGSGWQPVKTDLAALQPDGAAPRKVNALVVERGLDRLLVVYWYQTFTRTIASEYWRKLFLVHDALTSGRTDVALVRISTTLPSRDSRVEAETVDVVRPFAELVVSEVQQRLFRP